MTESPAPKLVCPVCGNMSFDREEERSDGKWGFTSHRKVLLICQRCSFILHFYGERSFFDVS